MPATTELGKAVVEQIELGRVDDDLSDIAFSIAMRAQKNGGQNVTNDFITRQIAMGSYDGNLAKIQIAVTERLLFTGQTGIGIPPAQALSGQTDPDATIARGDTIKVTGVLKPNYLMGHTFVVKRIGTKRGGGRVVVVDVPNEPQFRRFAGNLNTRIPMTAVAKVVA